MTRITWVSLFCIIALAMGLMLFGVGQFAPAPSVAAPVCASLLLNSDMESGDGWIFGSSDSQGGYSTRIAHSGVQSARLGVTAEPNVAGWSSMRQAVARAAGSQMTLKAWVFQVSDPPDAGDIQEIKLLNEAGDPVRTLWTASGNDRVWKELTFDVSDFINRNFQVYINVQNNGVDGITSMFVDDVYLEICDSGTVIVTATPTDTPSIVTATPTDTPNVVTATPTPIVVTNTPTPTPTSNVITATPTPIVVTNTPTLTPTSNVITATPTPIVVTNTPTPTPAGPIIVTNTPTPSGPIIVTNTPTPSGPIIVTNTPVSTVIPPPPTATYTPVPTAPDGGCKECIVNGGFENNKGWHFGRTVLRAGYVGDNPYEGLRSMLSGNANYSRPNYTSYSSFRQKVKLPKGYKTAFLEFWHYTISNQESGDYQELVILDGRTGRTLEVMWRVNRNDQSWQLERFDMTRYLGRSIVVYFNVYNNGGGGRASMYVDNVSLRLCPGSGGSGGAGGAQEPFPAHTPTPTSAIAPDVIIITATPTPAPATESQQPGAPTEGGATETPVEGGQTGGPEQSEGERTGVIIGTVTLSPPTATPTLTGRQATTEAVKKTLTPSPTQPEAGEGGQGGGALFSGPFGFVLQVLLYLALLLIILFIIFFLYRFIKALRAQRNQQA